MTILSGAAIIKTLVIDIKLVDHVESKQNWSIACHWQDNQEGPPTYTKRILEYHETHVAADIFTEIQWYLENYIQEPLQTQRAVKARNAIYEHGKQLMTLLDLANVLREQASMIDGDFCLVIRVDMTARDDDDDRILWELLERKELWPDTKLHRVVVLRLSDSATSETSPEGTQTIDVKQEDGSEVNILLVSARPHANEDLPPRLVSHGLVGIAEQALKLSGTRLNVDIVRPATIDALVSQLALHPLGHYQIIHFDTHGVEDETGRHYLRFLKAQTSHQNMKIEPHDVETAAVGDLLVKHGIPYAVMNACRSAKGSSVDSNIALQLVQSGLRGCAAMSANIVGNSVQTFTLSFYTKTSCFMAVDFDDSMVPVTYISTRVGVPLCNVSRSGAQGDYPDLPPYPIGREDDLLQIESCLLMGKKPVLVVGAAGIGKSAIVDEFQEWWLRSRLVKKTHLIRLSVSIPWNSDTMFSEIYTTEPGYKGSTQLEWFRHLKSQGYAILLDGLDVMTVPSGKLSRPQRRSLLAFVRDARVTGLTLLITSRAPERWLGDEVVRYNMVGLRLAAGSELLATLIILHKQANGAEIPAFTIEEGEFVEHIVKLVEGNALALIFLSTVFGLSKNQMRTVFLDLIGGRPLRINSNAYSAQEGFRCVKEIMDLSERYDNPELGSGVAAALVKPFWHRLVLEDLPVLVWLFIQERIKGWGLNARQRTTYVAEEAGTRQDETESGNSPSSDHLSRDCEQDDEMREFDFDELALRYDDVTINNMRTSEDVTDIKNAFDPLIKVLQDHLFLNEVESTASASMLQDRTYLSVHPMLPIILQTLPGWHTYRPLISRAFSTYTTLRMQAWPLQTGYQYGSWDGPNEEAHLEFFNFFGAALMFLSECENYVKYVALMKMLRAISHGTLRDASRDSLVIHVWEKAIELLLKQEAALLEMAETIRDRPEMLHAIPWGLSPTSPNKDTRDILDDEITHSRLVFQVRYQLFNFAMLCLTHHNRINSPRAPDYAALLERSYDDILSNPIAQEESPEIVKADLNHNLLIAHMLTGKTAYSAEKIWQSHGDHDNLMDQHFGGFPRPRITYRDLWDMPLERLGPAAKIARSLRHSREILNRIDEGDLDEARRLVDVAMLAEINDAANDLMNKARLFFHLSEIDRKAGNPVDADRHLAEAFALEQEAARSSGM